MLLYPCVKICLISCLFFVSFSKGRELSVREFDQHQCSSLCSNPKLNEKLKDICVAVKNVTREVSGLFLTDEGVRYYSKCEKNIWVQLKNENGQIENFQRDVGLCQLSRETTRCVTKGIKTNEIYHYDYDSTTKLCYNPVNMDYTFSASWTRFFSFLCFWKFL